MKRLLTLLFLALYLKGQSFAVDSLVSMIWGDDLPSRARRLRILLPYDFRDSEEKRKNKFSLKTLDLSPARLAEHERRFEAARRLEERGDNDGALREYLDLAKNWHLESTRKLSDICMWGGLGLRKNEDYLGRFVSRSYFIAQELALRRDIERFYETHGYYDTPSSAYERGMPPPRVLLPKDVVENMALRMRQLTGVTEEEARAWLCSGLPAAESARLPTAAEASAAEPGAVDISLADSTLPYSTPGDGEREEDSPLGNVLRKRRGYG